MDVRLIAMDLDGTALSFDRMHFSPRLERSLMAAYRRGIIVLPVTGRQFAMLPPALLGDQPWRDLVVLCNGGELRRLTDGTLLASRHIPVSALPGLLELARQLHVPAELSCDGTLYLTRESWEMERDVGGPLRFHLDEILRVHGKEENNLKGLCRRPDKSFEKALLPFIPDDCKAAAAKGLDRLDITWAWSGENSVEITGPDADKGNGLRDACTVLGLDPACAMAVGDSGNDVPMLRAAGLGVAMGGSPPEVLAAADEVTASNREDGAALAVERWALGWDSGHGEDGSEPEAGTESRRQDNVL